MFVILIFHVSNCWESLKVSWGNIRILLYDPTSWSIRYLIRCNIYIQNQYQSCDSGSSRQYIMYWNSSSHCRKNPPIKHIQVVLYCCSVNPFANYLILGSIHIHISISSHNYLTNLRTFSSSPDNLQRLESRQLHAALKGGAGCDEVIANWDARVQSPSCRVSGTELRADSTDA